MTLERQKYLEPFIIAQNQDKIIQFRSTTEWVDLIRHNILDWEFQNITPYEYRIKPEPREWYEIIYKGEPLRVFDRYPSETLEVAKRDLARIADNSCYEIIKMREVLDDGN